MGASVTFVATVTGNAPTGTMSFTDNGTAMASCAAVTVAPTGTTGTAVCTTSALTAGSHTIMATLRRRRGQRSVQQLAGRNHQWRRSGGAVATTTTLASSLNPSTVGALVMFTATVTGNSPTGTVSFTDSGASIGCAAVPLIGGAATCSTALLAQGTHTIVASYGGDAGNMGSSGMVSQVVNAGGGGGPTATTTTLVSSANPAASGASVTFTATVTGNAPTGSVNFMDGTGSISNCAVVALAAGSGNSRTAACTTTTLSVGTHSIAARYSGNATNATSTSTTISETITGTPAALVPKVAFTLSNTLIVAPQTVTITATATETGGSITKVSLYLNGAKLADLTTSPYTFTTAALPVGTHMFYATATDAFGNVTSTLTQNVVAISGAPPVATTDANVWRLLNQATFGASQAEAAKVVAMGIPAWIDNQFAAAGVGLSGHQVQRDCAELDSLRVRDAGSGGQGLPGRLAAGDLRPRSPVPGGHPARLLHQRDHGPGPAAPARSLGAVADRRDVGR